MKKASERLRKAFLDVVDNQLRANDPPETRQTFYRLINEGYSNDKARWLIAKLLVLNL
jgi:hypothetical protein